MTGILPRGSESPLPSSAAPGPTTSPFPFKPITYHLPVVSGPKRRPDLGKILLVATATVAIAGVVLIAALLTIDVPFAISVPSGGCHTRGVVVNFPVESLVSFHWQTSNGVPTNVSVIEFTGQVVYVGSGTQGSGYFRTDVPEYSFNATSCAVAVVQVSGNYVLGAGLR